jgi:hypothetical protein
VRYTVCQIAVYSAINERDRSATRPNFEDSR